MGRVEDAGRADAHLHVHQPAEEMQHAEGEVHRERQGETEHEFAYERGTHLHFRNRQGRGCNTRGR